MLFISLAGYVVNFFSARCFQGNNQISNTLGAFCIGLLANIHSRLGQRVENYLVHKWKKNRNRLRHVPEAAIQMVDVMPDEENPTGPEREEYSWKREKHNTYGLASAAMLPAIFVQVPSGLAVSGSLVSGLESAKQITGNITSGGTTTVNATAAVLSPERFGQAALNSLSFGVGYGVVMVAIGITVGLFLASVFVYPFGKEKKGSALFSF